MTPKTPTYPVKISAGVTQTGPQTFKINVKVKHQGQTHRLQETYQGTAGQAVDRRAVLVEVLREEAQGQGQKETTCTGWARLWLVEVAENKRSARTIEIYKGHLERVVLPLFGHMIPSHVTQQELKTARATLLSLQRPDGRAYSDKTLTAWWWILTSILKKACNELHIHYPGQGLKSPRRPTTAQADKAKAPEEDKAQGLTGKQIASLLKWTRRRRYHYYTLILWLFSTGTRQQAARLLRWEHIDLEARLVWVYGKGGHWRRIAISKEMASQLTQHRKDQLRRHGIQPLVFLGRTGKPWTDKAVSAAIMRTSKAWGTRITPHDARRAWITRALGAGASIADVAQHVGHKKLQQTLEYTRNSPEVRRRMGAFSDLATRDQGPGTPQDTKGVNERGQLVKKKRQGKADDDDTQRNV